MCSERDRETLRPATHTARGTEGQSPTDNATLFHLTLRNTSHHSQAQAAKKSRAALPYLKLASQVRRPAPP
jgi:hypothetical protein